MEILVPQPDSKFNVDLARLETGRALFADEAGRLKDDGVPAMLPELAKRVLGCSRPCGGTQLVMTIFA